MKYVTDSLSYPFVCNTFWFGGQSSTVLQETNTETSEGVKEVTGSQNILKRSTVIGRQMSLHIITCFFNVSYCLRRRSFWNSFRSFSNVGNSYRSSKTHLYRVWQTEKGNIIKIHDHMSHAKYFLTNGKGCLTQKKTKQWMCVNLTLLHSRHNSQS